MNEEVPDLNRRKFLQHSASLMAVQAAAVVLPGVNAQEPKTAENPMRTPGTLPRPYGERSPFEKPTRLGGAVRERLMAGAPTLRTISTR
jgi:sulfane dehydrogenase subunit SoxC